MLDPEFIEWLDEGTRKEVYAKKRKFIAYLREHPEIYTGKSEWLDNMEASINRSEALTENIKWSDLEIEALKYEINEADRELDETLLKTENLPQIPAFGKRKKDSH